MIFTKKDGRFFSRSVKKRSQIQPLKKLTGLNGNGIGCENEIYNGRPRNPSSVRKRLQLILERAGCVTIINDHLYEGRYTPTNAYGKRESHNIYAKTREECEEKLAEMIEEVNAQIKAKKEKMTG